MAARSIWNGSLKVGTKVIGVRLYSAVQDRGIHFHLLEERTKNRVKQHMVDPNSGKEIASGEIRKGFETESGDVVFLDPEDIASVQPERTDEIEVSEFLPTGSIPHQWYERPYYVGPDGDEKTYFALAQALGRANREGLARWVMRQKEYFGALRERDGYLALIALRYAEQVVSARELPQPAGRDPDAREIAMAQQLISTLEDEFDPAAYRDEYRDRVMKFIEEKAKGHKPKLATITARKTPKSLLDALAASLDATGKGGKAVA